MQQHHKANPLKLSEADVRNLMAAYRTGRFSQASLGRRWGVSRAFVHRLVHGVHWWYISGLQQRQRPPRAKTGNRKPALHRAVDRAVRGALKTAIAERVVTEVERYDEQPAQEAPWRRPVFIVEIGRQEWARLLGTGQPVRAWVRLGG